MVSQLYAKAANITMISVSKFYLGLSIHRHHMYFYPTSLDSVERSVTTYELFLFAKGFNNDTNEELYEEHTDYDHKNHKVNSHERVIILNRLKVGIRRVDCAPHDIDPALS